MLHLQLVIIIIFDSQMSRAKPVGRGAPTKKTTERPGLTADEIEELREAFNLFDTEATGKIDPR